MKKTIRTLVLVLLSVSFMAFTSCGPKDESNTDTPTPDNPTTSGDSWANLINETPHEAVVDGNTLTYGNHTYTVNGEINLDETNFQSPTAYVTFTLTEDNAIDIRYEATTDKTTVINMTNHSYFNLSGDPANHSIEADELYINAPNDTGSLRQAHDGEVANFSSYA